MKRLLVLMTVLFFSLTSTVRAAVVDRIAAVVNNDIITTYSLDQAMDAQIAQRGKQDPSSRKGDALRKEVLNQLIEDALFQQKIKELGLRVSDEEIASAIQDVEKQNHLNLSQLTAALKAQGMSMAAYRVTLRKQILRFKLVGREVRSKVEVSHQELLNYFRKHIDDYREKGTVRISDISFALPAHASGEQTEAARREAQQALARIKKGEDFTAVLNDYAATGAAQGGDMGTFAQGQLTPVFDRAIEGLKKGEVSQVVSTARGFHILEVTGATPGGIRNFDTVKDQIQRVLMKKKSVEQYRKWVSGLKQKAYIDIRL